MVVERGRTMVFDVDPRFNDGVRFELCFFDGLDLDLDLEEEEEEGLGF